MTIIAKSVGILEGNESTHNGPWWLTTVDRIIRLLHFSLAETPRPDNMSLVVCLIQTTDFTRQTFLVANMNM